MHLQSELEVLVFIRYCGEAAGYHPFFRTAPKSERESFFADRNETASDAISTLTISGKTAKCESKLRDHSDVKSCKVVQTLEKKWGPWIWNEVDGADKPRCYCK